MQPNLTGENFLLYIATGGIALGGFTGLLNAFRKAGRPWTPQEVVGMRLLFQHSLGAAFFGFLPFPLFATLRSEARVWLICSSVLALFLAYQLVYLGLKVRRTPPRRPNAVYFHFFPFTFVALCLQVICVWRGGLAWPYFWGLFWLLQPPAVQFYHFISFVPRSGSKTASTRATNT